MENFFEFGIFKLDTTSPFCLYKNGEVVKLPPKALKVLEELTKRPGELRTRDELFAIIWEDNEVEENNLDKNINSIRNALYPYGDYIKTEKTLGYKFNPPPAQLPLKNLPKQLDNEIANSLLNDKELLKKDNKDFKEFWGKSFFDMDIKLAFAFREVETGFETHIKTTNGFVPPLVNGIEPLPESIDHYLPTQDLRAAGHCLRKLSFITDSKFTFVEDKSIYNSENCIISFGLGWNLLTHKAQNLFVPKEKFFEIVWSNSPKETDNFPTDNFKIRDITPKSEDGFDVALIARIVRRSDLPGRHRTRFLVCGRQASGTSAAGYFLANHWETKLLPLYKGQEELDLDLNLDSMVVGIKYRISKDLWQDFDESGVIIEEDGKKLVAFARAIGIE